MKKLYVLLLLFFLFVSSCHYSYSDKGYDWYFDKINYSKLKDVKKTKEIKIGVIDSGIDDSYAHFFKKDCIEDPYDFIDNDSDVNSTMNLHGTYVSLLIASPKWNYVAGIDEDLKIVPIRVIKDDGTTTKDLLLKGLEYTEEKGCDVVNMSLGSTNVDPEIGDFIQSHNDKTFYVASAGDLSSKSFLYPANYPDVFAVQAIDRDGGLYKYSNQSSGKESIKGPGVGIRMEVRHKDQKDTYTFLSGSSYATAIVSGIIGSALRSGNINKENLRNNNLYTNSFLDCAKFIT